MRFRTPVPSCSKRTDDISKFFLARNILKFLFCFVLNKRYVCFIYIHIYFTKLKVPIDASSHALVFFKAHSQYSALNSAAIYVYSLKVEINK